MPKKKKRGKNKYGRNSFVSTVFHVFLSNPHKSYNFRQLSADLGITDRASKALVKEILTQLASDNEIIELKRGKYQLHPKNTGPGIRENEVRGIVDMKQTGKAYVITGELPEDVYIAPNNTNRALNGDEVQVMLFPKRRGRKTEGRIVEIIRRSKRQYVGIFEAVKDYGFVVPDDTSVPVDIFIASSGFGGAEGGQKVVAEITDWPEHSKNPFGKVVEVLGKPGDNDVEMKSILVDSGFPVRFPTNVEKEAEKIARAIPGEEYRTRRDFRNIFTCTIDPADAKDFDDALSVRKMKNGNWEVGVHIADVSYYVSKGNLIDAEAMQRGTSVYLVDRTIPMLPEALSNEVCSLRPDEDKLCFSAVFEMDEEGKVFREWFGKTVIRSDRRYNYEEVQAVIEGAEDPYRNELLLLNRMAKRMRQKRFSRGSIAFTSEEVRFELDEKGAPLRAYIRKQQDSNRLIEDFMLLANRKVAERIGRRRGKQEPKTFIYRIHDQPNPEKLNVFSDFVRKLGYKVQFGSRKALAGSLNRLFEEIQGKAEEFIIESIAIRTMAKAEYSTDNIGHYGLAFSYYTHFTSPIRRYPDLVVHRLLQRYLDGKPAVNKEEYEEICIHASEMERKALDAERASVKHKQVEFLLDKVGQKFMGLISGVSKWGLFIELDENKSEGLVPMRTLKDDFYYLDEDNFRIIGQNTGKEHKLGDRVQVALKAVDLQKKQIDMELV